MHSVPGELPRVTSGCRDRLSTRGAGRWQDGCPPCWGMLCAPALWELHMSIARSVLMGFLVGTFYTIAWVVLQWCRVLPQRKKSAPDDVLSLIQWGPEVNLLPALCLPFMPANWWSHRVLLVLLVWVCASGSMIVFVHMPSVAVSLSPCYKWMVKALCKVTFRRRQRAEMRPMV